MPEKSTTDADLGGRICLVTGANTGIGRATAVGLARRGAHVLLACRSAERTRAVLDEIAALPGDGSAAFVRLDLADLDTVRTAAAEVLDRLGPDGSLDLLINNAGLAGSKGVTAQGFELTFGVSHLGHFLLTTLLLDKVAGRVVNLSSKAHFGAKGIDFDALQQPAQSAGGLVEYQVAKLCNVLFTIELARRLATSSDTTGSTGTTGRSGTAGTTGRTGGEAGVTTCSVHPGTIRSDIWREVPWPIRPVVTLFMGSVGKGAARVLHGALDPALAARSDAYLDRGRPKPPSDVATPELAAQLWDRSQTWVE